MDVADAAGRAGGERGHEEGADDGVREWARGGRGGRKSPVGRTGGLASGGNEAKGRMARDVLRVGVW